MDIFSDFVVRVRVGSVRMFTYVYVIKSQFVKNVLNCLVDNGYVRGYYEFDTTLIVYLKYIGNKSMLVDIERISKISKRVYCSRKELEYADKKNIRYLVSTSRGIMMNKGDLFIRKPYMVGGEVLLKIK